MLFGAASLVDGIVNARSANPNGAALSEDFPSGRYYNKYGFQFYDTWVRSILSRVEFRGYNSSMKYAGSKRAPALMGMTHSDQFLPQNINSVRNLQFTNDE